MKRIIAIILSLVMIFALIGCGKSNRYTSSAVSQQVDNGQMDFSSYVTPISTAVPTSVPTPVPTATPAPTPKYTPTITAAPATTAISSSAVVTITKSPTSETVEVGGTASFLAYANNFSSISWILANADSSIIYDAANAPNYFPGLVVNGQGASLLKLSNIPYDLNGWRVQAIFNGNGGPKYTNIATITVIADTPEQKIAKELASTCRTSVASSAASYGFATSDITSYTFFSQVGDFTLTLTKGDWKVYGEFISDPNAAACYPLAVTIYKGTTAMTDQYPLTEQTFDAFYAMLSQLV